MQFVAKGKVGSFDINNTDTQNILRQVKQSRCGHKLNVYQLIIKLNDRLHIV